MTESKYLQNTSAKLNALISKLEERTGLTREILRSLGDKPNTAEIAIKKVNAPVSKPAPVEEKKIAEPAPVKQEEQKPAATNNDAAIVSPEEFAKLDIRVGKIIECWKHPESDKLYCEKIDIGGEIREIGSGLQKYVPIEDMKKDLVLVLVNLKPRKLAGFNSHGMVLCASNADHTAIELLRPDPNSKVGERVTLEGYDKISQDKANVIDPKKSKALETVLPVLKTDAQGLANFQNQKLRTSNGYIKAATLTNANIS